jgi:hypothetical protein
MHNNALGFANFKGFSLTLRPLGVMIIFCDLSSKPLYMVDQLNEYPIPREQQQLDFLTLKLSQF